MDAKPYKEIGSRLRELRESLQQTQAEFAVNCGINRGYLASLEVGSKKPSSNVISQLIGATDVSSNWLLTGEGDMFARDPYGDRPLLGEPPEDADDIVIRRWNAFRLMALDKTENATNAAMLIGAAPEKHRANLFLAVKRELFFLDALEEEDISEVRSSES